MKIALLFPGQGAQKVGMGKQLYENFSAARMVYEESSDALSLDITALCFDGPESDLVRTRNTQPAVLISSIAALRVLEGESGVVPSITTGHSLGEYSALVLAGGIELADAARVVRLRGSFMQEAAPEGEGAMAAIIGLEAQKVEKLCEEAREQTQRTVVPANYNSPQQIVISGHADAVELASRLAEDSGAKRVVALKVSAPFHSPLMESAAEKLEGALEKITFRDASCPVLSNVDTEPHTRAGEFAPLLVKQVVEPVRWEGCMKRLREHEVELAIEVGPGKVLCGLMRNIDRDIKTANVEDMASLNKTVSLIES